MYVFFLALSVGALASEYIKVKFKVSFWFRDYKKFKVAFVYKAGKEEKEAQKPGVGVEDAQKPSKEVEKSSLTGLMVDDHNGRCKDMRNEQCLSR